MTVDIFQPSEVLFRKKLRTGLAGLQDGDAAGFRAVRLQPITTAEKNALTDIEGLLVFDSDVGKLCIGTFGGWETVTST